MRWGENASCGLQPEMRKILGETLANLGHDGGVLPQARALAALVEAAVEDRQLRERQAELVGDPSEVRLQRLEAQQEVGLADHAADPEVVHHPRHAGNERLELSRV